MDTTTLRTLMITDCQDDASQILHVLKRGGFDPVHLCVTTPDALRKALAQEPWDVIISDYHLPQFNDLSPFDIVREVDEDIPFIIVFDTLDEETAVRTVRAGVHDCVLKDSLTHLPATVYRELREAERRVRRRQADEKMQELHRSLEHQTAQLRRLTRELAYTEQRERRRLAQLLHDHLQQLLTGAKLHVNILQNNAQGNMAEGLRRVEALLDESIQSSRSLAMELAPPVLYESGLVAALRWFAGRMADYGLKVHTMLDPSAEPEAEDLRILLFQSVRELLFNIIKHAHVQEARLYMARLSDNRLQITVQDDGAGFDPESPGREETFGLFSVRERLQLYGGSMQVVSAPGEGTCVTLSASIARPRTGRKPGEAGAGVAVQKGRTAAPAEYIPLREEADDDADVDHDDKEHIRVLIADDHRMMREGLVGLLQHVLDVKVVGEASDGEMAVDLARRLKPDIILMDVSMPKLGGIEATRRIISEMPDIRVIGLSMHESSAVAGAMREAGATAYVTKGGPSDALINAIRNCLHTYRQPVKIPTEAKAEQKDGFPC
ncbi:MAG TPA: response regulator [Chloroflexi bacterium]|nr:response regulator [Chloroflexota bacterium]